MKATTIYYSGLRNAQSYTDREPQSWVCGDGALGGRYADLTYDAMNRLVAIHDVGRGTTDGYLNH